MSEHTPGPWLVDEEGNVALSSGDMIAWTTSPDDMEVFGESPETWANARLIAAAPDMLAALRAYAAWADPVECAADLRPIREQIRTAIAKATAADETEGR